MPRNKARRVAGDGDSTWSRCRDLTSRVASARVGGDGRGSGAVLDAQFGVNLLEMLVHRPRAETKNLGDVAVGFSFGQPRQHFALAGGQSEFAGELGGHPGAGL